MIEIRNLIVHNRGIMTHAAIRKVPELKVHEVGVAPVLSGELLEAASTGLMGTAIDTDARACVAFGLPKLAATIGFLSGQN
jgi:hypothetical protein